MADQLQQLVNIHLCERTIAFCTTERTLEESVWFILRFYTTTCLED